MTELLSIGDKVAEGCYQIHSRFTRAVNFMDGRRAAFVVSEELGAGPLNIVIRDLPGGNLEPMVVCHGFVSLGGMRLPVTAKARYDSRLDIREAEGHVFERNLSILARRLLAAAPAGSLAFLLDKERLKRLRPGFETAFAERVGGAVGQIFHGELRAGVRALRGCGFGLTPSGDDFLAGVMFACHLSARLRGTDYRGVLDVIRQELGNSDELPAVFLSLARGGFFFEKLKTLASSLASGGENDVTEAADGLLAIGATSGADLATGLVMTLLRLGAADPRFH